MEIIIKSTKSKICTRNKIVQHPSTPEPGLGLICKSHWNNHNVPALTTDQVTWEITGGGGSVHLCVWGERLKKLHPHLAQ